MISKQGLELIEQYKVIHARKNYGSAGNDKAGHIAPYINFKVNILLDYGCGKSALASRLGEMLDCDEIYRYDPALPRQQSFPKRADLVICTDVMEHILEQDVISVFEEIQSISARCFFIICLRPAGLFLPDGRNAHVTVRPVDWWVNAMKQVFDVVDVVLVVDSEGFHAKTW